MGRLALFLLTACLSLTAMAADVIKGERKETFGDVTVHYNTFNSTFLTAGHRQSRRADAKQEPGCDQRLRAQGWQAADR